MVGESERGRRLSQQGLSAAPDLLQQARRAAASAAAERVQRASELIDAAPIPDPVKGPASDAAFNVWAAADQLGHSAEQASSSEQ